MKESLDDSTRKSFDSKKKRVPLSKDEECICIENSHNLSCKIHIHRDESVGITLKIPREDPKDKRSKGPSKSAASTSTTHLRMTAGIGSR
jgi:hypothetical protein